jgi:hypothetical protein
MTTRRSGPPTSTTSSPGCRVLGQSGWSGVRLTEISEPVHLGDDPDDAFAFVSQMGVTLGLLKGLDQATSDLSLARLRDAMNEVVTDHGVALPSRSWLVQAQRG